MSGRAARRGAADQLVVGLGQVRRRRERDQRAVVVQQQDEDRGRLEPSRQGLDRARGVHADTKIVAPRPSSGRVSRFTSGGSGATMEVNGRSGDPVGPRTSPRFGRRLDPRARPRDGARAAAGRLSAPAHGGAHRRDRAAVAERPAGRRLSLARTLSGPARLGPLSGRPPEHRDRGGALARPGDRPGPASRADASPPVSPPRARPDAGPDAARRADRRVGGGDAARVRAIGVFQRSPLRGGRCARRPRDRVAVRARRVDRGGRVSDAPHAGRRRHVEGGPGGHADPAGGPAGDPRGGRGGRPGRRRHRLAVAPSRRAAAADAVRDGGRDPARDRRVPDLRGGAGPGRPGRAGAGHVHLDSLRRARQRSLHGGGRRRGPLRPDPGLRGPLSSSGRLGVARSPRDGPRDRPA